MRYAEIVPFDVCNGKGCGTSLFVQGCNLKCVGCFNSEAWDFSGGKEWTLEIKNKFLDIVSRHYIKRVSILGGEPLENENLKELSDLIIEIKKRFPEKVVWIYTGKLFETLNPDEQSVVNLCDVVVDGAYVERLKDITLAFRGSSNQRLIDVQQSLKENQTILCPYDNRK